MRVVNLNLSRIKGNFLANKCFNLALCIAKDATLFARSLSSISMIRSNTAAGDVAMQESAAVYNGWASI